MGFVLEPEQAEKLISVNPNNKNVIFPYMNGDDLNNNPNEKASRFIINFFDWPEEKAKQFPECYSIVENLVKPERQRWVKDKNGNEIIGEFALRKPWAWKYTTKLKTDLIYQPADIFETFPFPQNLNPQQEQQLETIGEAYHEHRRQLMLGMQLGLTKTYNLFHSNAITAQSINDKDKQVASLQKHLEKTGNTP
jgi:hypothetical protein